MRGRILGSGFKVEWVAFGEWLVLLLSVFLIMSNLSPISM